VIIWAALSVGLALKYHDENYEVRTPVGFIWYSLKHSVEFVKYFASYWEYKCLSIEDMMIAQTDLIMITGQGIRNMELDFCFYCGFSISNQHDYNIIYNDVEKKCHMGICHECIGRPKPEQKPPVVWPYAFAENNPFADIEECRAFYGA
jgi:hypothetical protein